MKGRFSLIGAGSFYRGKCTTLVVYPVIILLAVGAYFLEPDYMAHVPVSVGVCAFDSAGAACVLEPLADYIREKGGGDIRWKYFGESQTPEGCDFYLLTSLQLYPHLVNGLMRLSLMACDEPGRCYTRGAVITRPETALEEIRGGKLIFSSPASPAGFLSPLFVLIQEGLASDTSFSRICFPDCPGRDERVISGVLTGEFSAGGIDLGSFTSLESRGVFGEGDLEVRYSGMPVTEIVLAADITVESWKYNGFTERLPAIVSKAPVLLKHNLESMGIGNFVRPGDRTPDPLGNFPDSFLVEMVHHLP